jgi:hypothetical protein
METQKENVDPMSAQASNAVSKKKNRPNPARRKTSQANVLAAKGPGVVKSTKDDTSPTKAVTASPHSASSSMAAEQVEIPPRASAGRAKARIPKPKAGNCPRPSGPTLANSSRTSNARPAPIPSALITTPAVLTTGGLLGCIASAAILLGAGLWKDVAGPSAAILTVRTAKHCVGNLSDELIAHLNAGTYNAPEALDILRRTTLAYACAIPGGAVFVERLFREVAMVRTQRAAEVDRVVAQACRELVEAGKGRASEEKVGALIGRQLVRLSELAGVASRDVLERNPAVMSNLQKAVKAAPAEMKTPTVKVNMVVRKNR